MAPNPRTAFGLVTHKKRAVLFGGILDQEGKVGWAAGGRGGQAGERAGCAHLLRPGLPCMAWHDMDHVNHSMSR